MKGSGVEYYGKGGSNGYGYKGSGWGDFNGGSFKGGKGAPPIPSFEGWSTVRRGRPSKLGKGKPWILCKNYQNCGGSCFYGSNPPENCNYCGLPFDFSSVGETKESSPSPTRRAKGTGKGKSAQLDPTSPGPAFDANNAAQVLVQEYGIPVESVPDIFGKMGISPKVIKPLHKTTDSLYQEYTKARGRYNALHNEYSQQDEKLKSLLEQVEVSRASLEELAAKSKVAFKEMNEAKAKAQVGMDQSAEAGPQPRPNARAPSTSNVRSNGQPDVQGLASQVSNNCSDPAVGLAMSQVMGLLQQILATVNGANPPEDAHIAEDGEEPQEDEELQQQVESQEDDFPFDWSAAGINGGASALGLDIVRPESQPQPSEALALIDKSPPDPSQVLKRAAEVTHNAKATRLNNGGKGDGASTSSSSTLALAGKGNRGSPY